MTSDTPPAGGLDDATAPESTAPAVDPTRRRVRVRGILDRPLITGFLATLGVIGGVVVGHALGAVTTVLLYVVLALVLAVGLDPIVVLLERRGLRRGAAIAIVFAGLIAVLTVFAVIILPPVLAQLSQFVGAIPDTVAALPDSDWYRQLSPDGQTAVRSAVEQAGQWLATPSTIAALTGGLLAASAGFLNGISATFVVIALTLYFLASLRAMKNTFYALSPARSRARVADLTERIASSTGRALLGGLVLSTFNAAAVLVLHLAIGLPFAALMAAMAFIVTLIPLFGSVIFLVLATAVALFSSPLQALLFAVGYLIYIQLESYVISPRVMNRAIAIPAALVLIGALAGGALLGVMGILIALPTMAAIVLVLREIVIPRQNAKV